MTSRIRSIASATVGLLAALSPVALAGGIEVIYTKIPGHPTAAIPGVKDLAGQPTTSDFRAIENLVLAPSGNRWLLSCRTQLGSDLETMLLVGSGTVGAALCQEGQPIIGGLPGELFDFFGSGLGRFDDNDNLAFSARARGGDPNIFQKVIKWTGGTNFTIAFKMGDLITGLQDLAPNPSGDEKFGNSVGSIHLLNDGRIGSQDSTIASIHTSRRPAIMYDQAGFHQTNVTTVLRVGGASSVTWKTISANTFYTSPNGEDWIAIGTINDPTTIDAVMVHNGLVVVQEGMTLTPSSMVVSSIFNADVASDGTWFARGADPNADDFAVRNGTLMAKTGDPITTGNAELWGNTFVSFNGDTQGNWVLAGNTNNGDPAADQVIVLNGANVVVREGDRVDLNADGNCDDDVFIGRGTANNGQTAFDADDAKLANDGLLYFIANLHNGAGQDLNSNPVFSTPSALLRINLRPLLCPGDADGDGDVDQDDLDQVLFNFGATPCRGANGDVNFDRVVDQDDLDQVLFSFGASC